MIGLVFNSTSPTWLLLEGVYIAAGIALLAVAYRAKSEWVRAGLGGLGLAVLGWHILAVLPSWWLYYSEGPLGWGGQGCTALDAACLKQTVKDLIIVIENAVGLGAFMAAFWFYQKKFPKQLAPGERKPEATGGYK